MPTEEGFIRKFSDTFLSDDIDGFMELIDRDCEWIIMATGEKFRGQEKVRELAERSVAARKHTKNDHMEFMNLFATEDKMCLEYIHKGIVTEKWPSSSPEHPVAGTEFVLPICLVCHIKQSNKKFDAIHEYFDLGTLTSAGKAQQRLYS